MPNEAGQFSVCCTNGNTGSQNVWLRPRERHLALPRNLDYRRIWCYITRAFHGLENASYLAPSPFNHSGHTSNPLFIMSSQQNALPRGNACLNCRRKKQKCDASKPNCHACEKSGKECVYGDSRSRPQLLAERINDLEMSRADSNSSSGNSSQGQVSPKSNASLGPSNGERAGGPPSANGSTRGGSSTSSRSRSGSIVPGARMVWYTDPPPTSPAFTEEVPLQLRGSLTEIFLRNRDSCCIDLHVPRFIASLAFPSTDSRAPHPAFVQAVMLTGCYFSRSPSLADYEIRFLAQTRREMAASIAGADRLHDYIRASNLVAFYYFCKGMYIEAYQQIAASGRLAISCGLHQIASSVWRPPSRPEAADQFLPYPRDGIDLGERIYTFWQTTCFDKIISMAVGQPSQLASGPNINGPLQVVTPWPRLISEYETGKVTDSENHSLHEIFNPSSRRQARPDTLTALRSQGMCLVEYALRLSQMEITAQVTHSLDVAVQAFLSRLGGLHNTGEMGEIPPPNGTVTPVNARMVFIRTLPHVASLLLFQHGGDPTARHRCGVAIQSMTGIIAELMEPDWPELYVGIGHLWFFVCEILIGIFHASPRGPTKDQVRRDVDAIMRAVRKLSLVYPPLGFRFQQLQQQLSSAPVC
ncbi:hypothetical protein FRB94_009406 [Tulasnella sp. JGI-2019a]|nr:hypothetical protein FRB94_009406 [Tulasnella sp. JGI-2019a]